MKRNILRGVLGGIFAGALVIGVSVTPASANITQVTSPANCSGAQVVVASDTRGNTWHAISAGPVWNKGYRNGGATTYTGWSGLQWVATEAPTIWSSGYRCA